MRGKQKTRRSLKPLRRTHKMKGGFVPSVMGNFLFGASKYITPLALFAGYKLYTKTKDAIRSNKRRTRRAHK